MQIKAYSESWQLDIFVYIEAYLEPMSQSVIVSHIQNRGYIQSVLDTLLKYYSRVIYACSDSYLGRFKHIQDPGITGSKNVNQQLPFKSGFSFKSLFRSIWNIFLFLFQDTTSILTIAIIIVCHSIQYATHENTPPIPHARTLPTQVRDPRYSPQHANHGSTPPALARIARHFSNSYTFLMQLLSEQLY